MAAFVRGQRVRILNFADQSYRSASEIRDFGEYGVVEAVGTDLISVKSDQCSRPWIFNQKNIVLAEQGIAPKPRRLPKGMTLRAAHLTISRRTNFRYSSDPEVKAAARVLIGFYKAHRHGGRLLFQPNLLRSAFVYADQCLRQGKKIK